MTFAPRSLYTKALLFIAFISTAASLWWFSLDSVRPFIRTKNNAVFLQPSLVEKQLKQIISTAPKPQPKQVTLLHFWNPNCLCNLLSQRHFDELLEQYDHTALRVFVIAPSNITAQQESEFKKLNGKRMGLIKSDFPFPASPALALFDDKRNLGYYGPYGFGAFCIPSSDSFFSSLIKRYRTEASTLYMNVIGKGCYCDWPIQYQP